MIKTITTQSLTYDSLLDLRLGDALASEELFTEAAGDELSSSLLNGGSTPLLKGTKEFESDKA